MNNVNQDIQQLLRKGEYLSASDLARQHLKVCPDDDAVRYLGLLALARSGATRTALDWYNDAGFESSDNLDYQALGARLKKDLALAAKDESRNHQLGLAARAYQEIFDRTQDYYPAINAATLYKLAGDDVTSRQLADHCIRQVSELPSASGLAEYYRLATLSEAFLLNDETEKARELLQKATAHAGQDYSAMSGTRKQLALIANPRQAEYILGPLQPPSVIHFCGHMMSADNHSGRLKPMDEARVARHIDHYLSNQPVGFGFGSLASGADILIAESLIQSGADLHVVLPFNIEEFREISVAPAGTHWLRRFEHCLDHATAVSYATEGAYLGDIHLFHLASRMAMGLAIQKSGDLVTSIHQLAIWDGENSPGPAGTAADIRYWQGKNLDSTLLASDGTGYVNSPPSPVRETAPTTRGARRPHAMLFGDIKGFSKLPDACLPAFVELVLGAMNQVLDTHESSINSRNTWGDGLFVVFKDAVCAAECALDLQVAINELPLSDYALPETLALRLGIHFGPVYEMQDPILKRPNFFGADVSKAARIEPITPVGEVYVTRQMAAELALNNDRRFVTEYVGRVSTAKNYGEFPMYWLRH